jgi:hypothetical protein
VGVGIPLKIDRPSHGRGLHSKSPKARVNECYRDVTTNILVRWQKPSACRVLAPNRQSHPYRDSILGLPGSMSSAVQEPCVIV